MPERRRCAPHEKRGAVLIALLLAAGCWVLAGLLRDLYADVDNFAISIVTNGLYGEENYCIYLHPLLCWMIGGIARVLPSADAFALLGRTLIYLETAWLLYLALRNDGTMLRRLVCVMLVLYASAGVGLWNINYTVQAASFAFTGLISLILPGEKPASRIAIGTMFLAFGIMWRVQAALLFVPFVLLEIFVTLIERRGGAWLVLRAGTVRYAGTLLCVVALLASLGAVRASERYADGVKYDEARSALEDFPTLPWEQVEDKLDGVTETEYLAAQTWFLSDTETLDSDALARMAAAGKTTAYPLSLTGLRQALADMIAFRYREGKPIEPLFLILIALLARILVSRIHVARKVESLLACIGGALIVLYFTFQGRALLRVWESVIYAILLILVAQLSRDERSTPRIRLVALADVLVIAFALWGVVQGVAGNGIAEPHTALLARAADTDERYAFTYQDDALYLWEDWHRYVSRYYMAESKLPTRTFLTHNICRGDWVYGQPYFIEHLNAIGVPNPGQALLERENTFLIAEDCSLELAYLLEHAGEGVQVVQVGTFEGVPIWYFVDGDGAL